MSHGQTRWVVEARTVSIISMATQPTLPIVTNDLVCVNSITDRIVVATTIQSLLEPVVTPIVVLGASTSLSDASTTIEGKLE